MDILILGLIGVGIILLFLHNDNINPYKDF